MSDSDFGGFDAPVFPRSDLAVAGTSKPNSGRAQAGPSKAIAAGTANAARRKAVTVDGSDDEARQHPPAKKGKVARSRKREPEELASDGDDIVEVQGDDIEQIKQHQPKAKTRAGSKKPSPPSAGTVAAPLNVDSTNNALASGVNKEKGKVRPKLRPQNVDELEANDVEVVTDRMDVDIEGSGRTNMKAERMTAHAIKNGKTQSSSKHDKVLQLQEQLAQANTHISDLTQQLNELLQVRHTEPEQLLERMEAQHQAQIKAQDSLVEDLKAKLAQSDPLLRSGKTAVFELLTREEADKEVEKLQQQIKAYRDIFQEREQHSREKDERISALEQETKDLRFELKMEIDRGKQLVDKNLKHPSSVPHTNAGSILSGNKDPKLAEIIKFYEDLTNVIIPSIKMQPGRYLNTSEWLMNCCYTYKDVTDEDTDPKSLIFAVRLCRDLKSGESEPVERFEQLVESVHYIPRELDKETPEFVESLGFLNDTFTFERDQLSLFLRTLHDNISGEGNDEGDQGASSDEDSVVILK